MASLPKELVPETNRKKKEQAGFAPLGNVEMSDRKAEADNHPGNTQGYVEVEEYDRLKRQLNDSQSTVHTFYTENKELKKNIEKLKDDMEKSSERHRKEFDELHSSNLEKDTGLEQMQKRLGEAADALQMSQSTVHILYTKNKELKKNIEKLEHEMEKSSERHRKEFDELHSSNLEKDTGLEQMQKILGEAADALQMIEHMNENLEKSIKELIENKKESAEMVKLKTYFYEKKLKKLRNDNQILQTTNSKQVEWTVRLVKEREDLRHEKQNLVVVIKKQAACLQRKIREFEVQISNLTRQVQEGASAARQPT